MLKTFLLCCLFLSASAQADNTWDKEASRYLQHLLKTNPGQLQELAEPVILNFYQARQYKPLWSNANGRLNRAYDLFHAISNAEDEGLNPADYQLAEIREYWNSNSAIESAQLDLLMSAALLRYSTQVHTGRLDSNTLDPSWHIPHTPLDTGSLFNNVAKNKLIAHILKNLPPQHSGYQLLKKQLRIYRELAQKGGWNNIEPGPILKPGVQHKQVLQLRQRLKLSRDLDIEQFSDMDIYNHELETAVMRFQTRHGLKADGRVGPQTRNALNIPVGKRIQQIRINMERWRWMPRYLGKRYLVVNMTGFELYIMKSGSVVLDMPVIIGKAYRATPSFSGWVSVMEYNPYWTIPTNLALKDFVPRQIRDPGFLARKSIKVFRGWGENAREIDPQTVDWRKLDKEHFPYWLRQDKGPKNALGRVKFLFSNPYEIYLHGTPDKHLFNRAGAHFQFGLHPGKRPGTAGGLFVERWQSAGRRRSADQYPPRHQPECEPAGVGSNLPGVLDGLGRAGWRDEFPRGYIWPRYPAEYTFCDIKALNWV